VSVLCDRQIKHLCDGIHYDGPPMIDPFREENVQPASIDLLMSTEFRVFKNDNTPYIDLGDPSTFAEITEPVHVPAERGFTLHSGEFVLAATDEVVRIPDGLVARIEGKSSLGRLGLVVHATAGYIDPGFVGKITLEMANFLRIPIILRPGKPMCQLSFHQLSEQPDNTYHGRYQGDMGVAPSRFGQPTPGFPMSKQAPRNLEINPLGG
jgi:dCTP deaminase